MARAVQKRRFLQRFGDGHEERLEHDDVVGRNRARQYHDPERVDQLQAHDRDVIGDQAAAEEHRDGQYDRDQPAPAQRGDRERIGHQRRGQQHDERAHRCVLDGVPVVEQYAVVAQQRLIGLQREAHGQQIDRRGLERLRVAHGERQHIEQRIEEGTGEENHQYDEKNVEGGCFCTHD